jgi:uncharacterized protein YgiB involved in biofilm formation
MKKSKAITLLFVTGILSGAASAQTPAKPAEKRLYVRSDTTKRYNRAHTSGAGSFFVFRAFGAMRNGQYVRQGYTNPAKPQPVSRGTVSRGGFGRSVGVAS